MKSPKDKNNELTCPIEHLEYKKQFLEVVHDALTVSKKVDDDRKKEVINQTKKELSQFDKAIEILRDHHADEIDDDSPCK